MKKKIVIFICIITFLTIGSFVVSKFSPEKETLGAAPKDGLVVYWNMDAGDVSGTTIYDKSGNNLNTNGSVSFPTKTSGKIKESLSFNGTNSIAWRTDTTNSILDIKNAITISVWIYPRDTTAEYDRVITKQWDTDVAPWVIYSIERLASTQRYVFVLGFNDSYELDVPTVSSAPLNQWSHIVGTYDGTTSTMYFNGEEEFEKTHVGTLGENNRAVCIGGNCAYAREYFNGKIDETRVYNRALSADEVKQLYNSTNSTHTNTPTKQGLVGYWSMDADDINGTTVYEKSGNNYNGTIHGNPVIAQGKIKQALDFDNTGDYTSIGLASFASVAGTITAYCKLDDTTPSHGQNAFCIGRNRAGNYAGDISLFLYYSAARMRVSIQDGVNSRHVDALDYVDTNWHHYALVWSSSATELFIDGVSQGTDLGIELKAHASRSFAIGMSNGEGTLTDGYPWDGKIDEVRIYNYALSAQEVTELYNSAKTSYTASAPKEGLVGYWNMDAGDIYGTKVYDKSGYNIAGTRTGASGANNTPQPVEGKINQALNFDGTDDNITLTNYLTGDVISYGAWIKTSVPGFMEVLGNGGAGALNSGIEIFFNTTYKYPICRFDDGVAEPSVSDTSLDLTDNKWHHIFCTKDASDNKRIYVDGVLKNTNATALGDISSSDNLYIGSYNGTTGGPWNGSIDDVRIYNRALSANEVKQLYEATSKTHIY